MMFARLRRSAALWISPDLRLESGPVPVGYFNVREAEAHARARREWRDAEHARLSGKKLGEISAECRGDLGIQVQALCAEPFGDVETAVDDVDRDIRRSYSEPTDETEQNEFQDTSLCSRVLQYAQFALVHLTSSTTTEPEPMEKGDSSKPNSDRGAA